MTTTENPPPTDADVSALAHRFWEEEGQPEGKAEEHWQRAQEQLRGPTGDPTAAATVLESQSAALEI